MRTKRIAWFMATVITGVIARGSKLMPSDVFHAAARGQLSLVRDHVHSGIDPLAVDARGYGIVSNIIHGLQQQLERFPSPGWNTSAHHAALETLTNISSAVQLLGVNDSVARAMLAVSCPVVDASGLRVVRWVPQLLDAMTKQDVHDCLRERNAWGETVAHVAASSKASGFARIVLRASHPTALLQARWMEAVTKVAIRALAEQVATQREVSFSAIVRATDDSDLRQLLAAAHLAMPQRGMVATWLSTKDGLGRTAIATACSQGRWSAALSLLQTLRDATCSNSSCSLSPDGSEALERYQIPALEHAVSDCGRQALSSGFGLGAACGSDVHEPGLCLLETEFPGVMDGNMRDNDERGQGAASGHVGGAVESLQRMARAARANSCTAQAMQRGGHSECKPALGWAVPMAEHLERVRSIVGRVVEPRPVREVRGPSAAKALRECLLHGQGPCVLRAKEAPGAWNMPLVTGKTRFAESQTAKSRRQLALTRRRRESGAWTAVTSRAELLAQCGSLPTRLSGVPYSDSYALGRSESSTLGRHARDNMGIAGMRRLTAWLLQTRANNRDVPASAASTASGGSDGGLGEWRPPYSFQALPAALIERLVPTPSNATLDHSLRLHIAELIIGPAGSGAMPHFHGPAANALAVGSKLWIVSSPACASFSNRHPGEWLQLLPVWVKQHPLCASPWVFLQHAGDTVAVPRHFGHAVYNLEDTVAIAYEQP